MSMACGFYAHFLQDERGKPTQLVTIAIPRDQLKHMSNKAERLGRKELFSYHRILEVEYFYFED